MYFNALIFPQNGLKIVKNQCIDFQIPHSAQEHILLDKLSGHLQAKYPFKNRVWNLKINALIFYNFEAILRENQLIKLHCIELNFSCIVSFIVLQKNKSIIVHNYHFWPIYIDLHWNQCVDINVNQCKLVKRGNYA